LGIPRGTSLLTILLTIQNKIINRIKVADTNSVDFTFECGVLTGRVKIDPTSTLPYSIGPSGIKLDCCPFECSNLVYTLDVAITQVVRASNHYNRHNQNQFTLSDTITQIQYVDDSSLIGDSLLYLNYIDLFHGGTATITSFGQPFQINTTVCAGSLVGVQKQFVWEMTTSRGCVFTKNCNFYIERVNFSERLAFGYRSNYQMNDMPLMATPGVDPTFDKGMLYFNDVRFDNTYVSKGGLIRKMYLNRTAGESCQIETIAGKQNISTINTLNNVWGNDVAYDYNSSIVLDRNEISYNEPVIYFATFGGVVCRLVRERDSECDERANWKNYVIAGSNGTTANSPTIVNDPIQGNLATFNRPYTLKRWFDVNNEPSFLIKCVDSLLFIYYKGGYPNGKNNSQNWVVHNLGVYILGDNANINVEDSPLASEVGKKRIWVLTTGSSLLPTVSVITFPFTNPNLGQLTNTANYNGANKRTVISMGNGVSNIVNSTGNNSSVLPPLQICRVNTNVGYHYLLTTLYGSFTTCSTNTLCNGDLIKIEEASAPTSAADYTISKLIDYSSNPGQLNSSLGNFGTFANSKLVYGMFRDLQNNHYDHCLGGMRKLDFVANTFPEFLAGSQSSVQTQIPGVNPCSLGLIDVDSLYEHKLDCDNINCDKPRFNVVQLSNTSFTVLISNYNPSMSYDLSIDGGISYVQLGITNPYTYAPVVPGAVYTIVIRVNCSLELSVPSDPYVITIPNDEVKCETHTFLITNVTQNAFVLNVNNPVLGYLYSVSIDGGLTYIVSNVSNPVIPISGLSPNTLYQIALKVTYPSGLICYAAGQSVKTLQELTYCIDLIDNVIGTTHNITATLRDSNNNPVTAPVAIPVVFYMNDGTISVSGPHTILILAGSASGNTIVTSANGNAPCINPDDWTNCNPYDITKPCLCEPNICPCRLCLGMIGIDETKTIEFYLTDCQGQYVPAPSNINISFQCAGQVYNAVMLAGNSTVPPTQYGGCPPNGVTNLFTVPALDICDPAAFL
jgi:hypothetical protein